MLLVFDCTNRATFDALKNWLSQVDQHAEQGIQKFLICNKIDSPNRQVSLVEAQGMAQENGLQVFECSAKTGEHVEEMFSNVCSTIVSQALLRDERAKEQLAEPV